MSPEARAWLASLPPQHQAHYAAWLEPMHPEYAARLQRVECEASGQTPAAPVEYRRGKPVVPKGHRH